MVTVSVQPGSLGVVLTRDPGGGVVVAHFKPVGGQPGPLESAGVPRGAKLLAIDAATVRSSGLGSVIGLLQKMAGEAKVLTFGFAKGAARAQRPGAITAARLALRWRDKTRAAARARAASAKGEDADVAALRAQLRAVGVTRVPPGAGQQELLRLLQAQAMQQARMQAGLQGQPGAPAGGRIVERHDSPETWEVVPEGGEGGLWEVNAPKPAPQPAPHPAPGEG